MGLAKTKEKLFDLRTVDRYVEKGTISRQDQDKFISALKDVEKQAEIIPVEAILGEEGRDPNRRRNIAAYTHNRKKDYSNVSYDEFDDDDLIDDDIIYGIDKGELTTLTEDEVEE